MASGIGRRRKGLHVGGITEVDPKEQILDGEFGPSVRPPTRAEQELT
jgi:hypothetical protein